MAQKYVTPEFIAALNNLPPREYFIKFFRGELPLHCEDDDPADLVTSLHIVGSLKDREIPHGSDCFRSYDEDGSCVFQGDVSWLAQLGMVAALATLMIEGEAIEDEEE